MGAATAALCFGLLLALRSTLLPWEQKPEILLLRDHDRGVQWIVRIFTVAILLLGTFGVPCP